jgi:hypothetical protein|tara:strand:+ start:195 stop:383 length:189 start_codon:yes stop_codon:yes gene_type:complete
MIRIAGIITFLGALATFLGMIYLISENGIQEGVLLGIALGHYFLCYILTQQNLEILTKRMTK